MEAVAIRVDLDCPRKSGATKRQSLAQVKKTLGRIPKGWVEDKTIPAYGKRLWDIFWELDSGRQQLEPISYGEIRAYMGVTGALMSPLDVKCIKAMDNARIRETLEVSKQNG